MSKDELHALVQDFKTALVTLQEQGCYGVSDELIAGQPEPQLSAKPAETATVPDKPTGLAQLREELGDCQACALAKSRNHIVYGAGSENAKLMFIGEAPGDEEDREGEPFVGPAGQLLSKMIVAMGQSREGVYIAHVLKCRPPNGRDPLPGEVAACQGFLAKQIALVAPEVIVTLGKPAAWLLLGIKSKTKTLRGHWQDYQGTPVMPTFHPSYLLRDPSKKKEAWADLQQVIKRLSGQV